MHAAVVNASKRWLNRILMRAFAARPAGLVPPGIFRARRQCGAVMLEAVAAVGAMGVVAGSAIHFHTEAQHKALETQVTMSASAFASGLNMQQAAAALGKSRLVFNKDGFAIGLHGSEALTSLGCEALWKTLLVTADTQATAEYAIGALRSESHAPTRGWQMFGDGASCTFTFREPSVGSKSFSYSAMTGQVTILPATSSHL